MMAKCSKCGKTYSKSIISWPMIFWMIIGRPTNILQKYGLSLFEDRPRILKADRKRHRIAGKLAIKRRLRFLKHKWFCDQKVKLIVIPRLMNEAEWNEWNNNGCQRVWKDNEPGGFIINENHTFGH